MLDFLLLHYWEFAVPSFKYLLLQYFSFCSRVFLSAALILEYCSKAKVFDVMILEFCPITVVSAARSQDNFLVQYWRICCSNGGESDALLLEHLLLKPKSINGGVFATRRQEYLLVQYWRICCSIAEVTAPQCCRFCPSKERVTVA
jgi:hypothetical protein